MAPLSAIAGYVSNGRPLGLTGSILIAVSVLLRIGYMLWRRSSRRRR